MTITPIIPVTGRTPQWKMSRSFEFTVEGREMQGLLFNVILRMCIDLYGLSAEANTNDKDACKITVFTGADKRAVLEQFRNEIMFRLKVR